MNRFLAAALAGAAVTLTLTGPAMAATHAKAAPATESCNSSYWQYTNYAGDDGAMHQQSTSPYPMNFTNNIYTNYCKVPSSNYPGDFVMYLNNTNVCMTIDTANRTVTGTTSCGGSAEAWHVFLQSDVTYSLENNSNNACIWDPNDRYTTATYDPCSGSTAQDQFEQLQP